MYSGADNDELQPDIRMQPTTFNERYVYNKVNNAPPFFSSYFVLFFFKEKRDGSDGSDRASHCIALLKRLNCILPGT